MVLTLLVSFVPGTTLAAENMNDEVQEKGILALETLNLNDDKTNFSSLDSSYAKENGLIDEEISNIKSQFLNLSDEDASIFVEAKKELDNKINTMGIKDTFTLAAAIAGMVVVGQAFISNLLSDLYQLGAEGFCNSWAGDFSAIDNACESLGYK